VSEPSVKELIDDTDGRVSGGRLQSKTKGGKSLSVPGIQSLNFNLYFYFGKNRQRHWPNFTSLSHHKNECMTIMGHCCSMNHKYNALLQASSQL